MTDRKNGEKPDNMNEDLDMKVFFDAQKAADEKLPIEGIKAARLEKIVGKDPILAISYSVCALSLAVILLSFIYFPAFPQGGASVHCASGLYDDAVVFPAGVSQAAETIPERGGPGAFAIQLFLIAEGFVIFFVIIFLEYLWNLFFRIVRAR